MAYRMPQSMDGAEHPSNIKIDVKRSVESLGYSLSTFFFQPTNCFNTKICLGTKLLPASPRISFASADKDLCTPQGLPIHSAVITTFFAFKFGSMFFFPTCRNRFLRNLPANLRIYYYWNQLVKPRRLVLAPTPKMIEKFKDYNIKQLPQLSDTCKRERSATPVRYDRPDRLLAPGILPCLYYLVLFFCPIAA